MAATSRKAIFAQAAKKLRQDFEELSTVPHNALKGGEAERLVRAFLKAHLPKRFDVGAGFIIDPFDNVSRQSDVVIYDAYNCPVYRASEDAAIFPSDNVAAVVEVKSRLTKDRLREAFENIASTKSLRKGGGEAPGALRTQTYASIFAFASDIALDTISECYARLLSEFPLGAHPDLILILDRAVFSLACKPRGVPDWAPVSIEGFGGEAGEGTHLAISYFETNEGSLDVFFRLLLANLILFREHVSHPGFSWAGVSGHGEAHLRYLTSLTTAKDPDERKRRLREYGIEVRREFESRKGPEMSYSFQMRPIPAAMKEGDAYERFDRLMTARHGRAAVGAGRSTAGRYASQRSCRNVYEARSRRLSSYTVSNLPRRIFSA